MQAMESEKRTALVSVIVPAYNVEKYIEKCLSSISGQTYRNLEILVVDDGAKDRSGELADRAAERDARIRVIHQTNAGVSAARNRGIDEARGEYIVFVDGDDYLAPDYVEYMLALVKETGADYCLSKRCFTKEGEAQTRDEQVEMLPPTDATALLLSPEVIVGCWDKIYKKSWLDENNLRFSTELFYGEGLSFITTAAQLANCVGVGNRKVYYYRRNNQTSATTVFDIAKIYNGEKSIKLIEEKLHLQSPKVQTMLKLHLATFYLGAVVRILACGKKKDFAEDCKRWMAYVRRIYPTLLRSKEVSVYRKLMLLGGCISPWFVMKLDVIRRKRIAENSIVD